MFSTHTERKWKIICYHIIHSPWVMGRGMISSLQHRPTATYCLHRVSGSNGEASFLDVHVTRMGRDVSCQLLGICWQHRDEWWDVGIMGSFPNSAADESRCPLALFYIILSQYVTASPLPLLQHCPACVHLDVLCSMAPSSPSPLLPIPLGPHLFPLCCWGWL